MEKKQTKKQNNSKLGTIITLSVLSIVTIVIYVLSNYIFGEASVFNRSITSNDFINTLYNKIPAILKTIQIVTITWLLSLLIRFALKRFLARTTRGATIVKLINSFIKYLIAIIAIMMILGAWGVNTQTLLASAGILSLVIGLGAQSLIADIIAGIFIVVEGEYQENMNEHVAESVGFLLAVNDMVVYHAVAEEKSDDNQKRHAGKIQGVEREIIFKIGG